jgi:hypothetical protein
MVHTGVRGWVQPCQQRDVTGQPNAAQRSSCTVYTHQEFPAHSSALTPMLRRASCCIPLAPPTSSASQRSNGPPSRGWTSARPPAMTPTATGLATWASQMAGQAACVQWPTPAWRGTTPLPGAGLTCFVTPSCPSCASNKVRLGCTAACAHCCLLGGMQLASWSLMCMHI